VILTYFQIVLNESIIDHNLYFEGRSVYNSEEVPCFCKDSLNEFVNCGYHRLSNPYTLDDIMICDAHALIKPICYITPDDAVKYMKLSKDIVVHSIGEKKSYVNAMCYKLFFIINVYSIFKVLGFRSIKL
jgi:hypothetical protein